MNIERHEPWQLLNQLHGDLDRLFGGSRLRESLMDNDDVDSSDWLPAVDIREEANQYILHADIPGVDPDQIDVTLENGVLTLRGERSSESSNDEQGYKRVERAYGTFYRRFNLPKTTDAENVSARYKDGVLEVTIPKHPEVMPKRIQVNS